MSDLWTDEGFGGSAYGGEGFGGDDDWDEGEESLETDVEEGFGDPDELEDDEGWAAEDEE